MLAKTMRVSILVGIFLFLVMPLQILAEEESWWDDAWSFRQEIILDLKTDEDHARYQPVDLSLRFDSPCWAVNETKHSVRVICQNKNNNLEVESQLYELMHCDEDHIVSCNLVFLIPPEADGTERYYIYYDESPTISPEYPDYVSIKDSSYYYEPIPGYPLESHFYQISQDDSIRYVVAQEGKFLWYTTAQCVTKLKESSTEVVPNNGVAIASFEFVYYHAEEMWQYSSTSQELLSKEILCDGNLMVSCKIVSRSTDKTLRTTAVYKYFYCPTSLERIQVHVVHEALKECQVYETSNTDGTYASLQCGGIQSASIADLNFGTIFPYFHLYSEHDTIEEYRVDLNPESTQKDPVIWLLTTSDDVDMGTNAWVSFDEGGTGTVHALIFGSPSVVKSGENERDGIQLKAYESKYPHLPGLDYTIAAIECSRNAYEKNIAGKDMVIPEGFVAEYDAEFVSSPYGGYPLIEKEAQMFQTLVPMKPSVRTDDPSEDAITEQHVSLTVFVHHVSSFPFGSVFSAFTGRRFPYVTVEVHRDARMVYAGTAGRLPLKGSMQSEEGSSLKDVLVTAIHMIDFRNFSLFKRVYFESLEPGCYVVKVFKDNPRFGNQRRFIGSTVVDLTKNSSIHMFCHPQGSCEVTVIDQKGSGVADAQVVLFQHSIAIAQNTTDADGVARLAAPCNQKESYQLVVLYRGFELVNESIRLRYSRTMVPFRKTVELSQYDWMVTLVDLWGLPLEIDVIPRLTSTAMQTPIILVSEKKNYDSYQFKDLLSAKYLLQIQYKSFSIEKEISIPSPDGLFVFPAEFPVKFHVFDSQGNALHGATIQMSRGGKTKEIRLNGSIDAFSVPPGLYLIKVVLHGIVIGQRTVWVISERSVDLITIQEPILPVVVFVFFCVFVTLGFIFGFMRKNPMYCLFLFIIGIFGVSLVLPWWSLQGASLGVQTSSTLFLVPLHLVSMTMTSEIIAGDLAFLPEIFSVVIMLIPVLTIIISLLVFFLLISIHMKKEKWQLFLLIGCLAFVIASLVVFVSAMSVFTKAGVGSFMGQGMLSVSIPGTEYNKPVLCQWGPGVGFWLYLICGIILIATFIIQVYKKMRTE